MAGKKRDYIHSTLRQGYKKALSPQQSTYRAHIPCAWQLTKHTFLLMPTARLSWNDLSRRLRLNLGDRPPAFCLGSIPFLSEHQEQLPESQEMGEADLSDPGQEENLGLLWVLETRCLPQQEST